MRLAASVGSSWAIAAMIGALALGACKGPDDGGQGGGGATTGTDSGSSSSSGTSDDGGPVYAPSGFSCSGKTPSLSKDVVPITVSSCSNQACHPAMTSGSGVDGQFVNRISEECGDRMMVTPGDPEGSYVIHKLTGKNLCSPFTTMPLMKPMLSAADVQTVYDWICEGAPNN